MDTRDKLQVALVGMKDVFRSEWFKTDDGPYTITIEYPLRPQGTQRYTFPLFADEIAIRSIEGLRVRIRGEIPDLPPDRTGQAAWEYAVAQVEHFEPDMGGEHYHRATYAISPAAVMYARKRIAEAENAK